MSRKYFFCFPRNILSDRKLSKIFSKFFWKLLLFMFHATLIIMSRKYFFGFQSPDWRVPFNVRQSPLMNQKTRPLSYRIQKGQDIGGQWFPFVMRSRKAGLPFATRVRPSPPMSVQVHQCPSLSVNVHLSPPMSVRGRQCPSMSANVPKNTSVVS